MLVNIGINDMGISLLSVFSHVCNSFYHPTLPQTGLYNVYVIVHAKSHLLKCVQPLVTQVTQICNNSRQRKDFIFTKKLALKKNVEG
jgi:hypothetical protein